MSSFSRWIRAARPGAVLLALLQRTPLSALLERAEDIFGSAPATVAVRSAVVFAGMGAIDSLAGASISIGIISSAGSPRTVTLGQPMTPVVFDITNGNTAESWTMSGSLPPGLSFGDPTGTPSITAAGSFNSNFSNSNASTFGTAVIKGTPTSPGSYSILITGYEYPNQNGPASTTLSYTFTVQGGINITAQPASQYVASGSTVVFTTSAVDVGGSNGLTYQWYHNGVAMSGATSPRLVISHAGAGDAGNYHCAVTGTNNTVVTTDGVLTLASAADAANPGRLINLSVNAAFVARQVLTVGMFTSPGSGPEPVLVRGMGPSLVNFGVSTPLADPTLALFQQNVATAVATNDNWGANQAAVVAADAATGAFPPQSPSSLDAALVANLSPSTGYTAQVQSVNPSAAGTAVAEFYDATAGYTTANTRMINLSSRTDIVASGSLTAGFVVGGSTARTVLIRAVGPDLATYGVGNAIPDPQLTVYAIKNAVPVAIASNAGWGNDPQLAAIMSSVQAFALTNPNESVLLLTLSAGSYTAVASSASGAAGNVLVEVYEVP